MRPLLLLVLLCCLWIGSLTGHEVGIHHLTPTDGLPHSTVFCAVEDQRGFVWLGTDDGLARYDGHHFQRFGPTQASGSASVTGLACQPDGTILAGYYRKALVQVNDCPAPELTPWPMPFGYDLVLGEGVAYFSRQNTLFRVAGGQAHNLHIWQQLLQLQYVWDQNRANLGVNIYALPRQAGLLVGCEVGLFLLAGDSLRPYAGGLLDGIPVHSLTEDAQGRLWVGSRGELLCLQGGRIIQRYREGFPPGYRLHRLLYDQRGHLWISVLGHGLCRLDTYWNKLTYLSPLLGIGATNINHLMEDRAGNIWVSTQGAGVFVLYPALFKHYGQAQGLKNGHVTALAQDGQDRLFIGQGTGLSVLPQGAGPVQEVFSHSETYIFDLLYVPQAGIHACLHFPPQGTRLFSSAQWPALHLWPAFAIAALPDSALLIAPNRPAPLLYQARHGHKRYELPFPTPEGLDRVKVMAAFADGETWVGQREGLYRIASLTSGLGQPRAAPSPPTLVWPHEVHDLLVQGDSLLWVGSGVGLWRWDRQRWQHYTPAEGLPHQVCTSLACDGHGRLWVGTPSGLWVWGAEGGLTLGRAQGLRSEEVTAVHYDARRNFIWAGTSNGLYSLDLAELPDYRVPQLQVYVTQLEAPDSTYAFPHIVTLPQSPMLRFHFTALYHALPSDLTYAYQLGGTNWQITSEPVAHFVALAAGNHTFRVKARTPHSEWSAPVEVELNLTPPLWRSPWFFLLLTVLGIALAGLIAYFRLREVRRQEAQKRQFLYRINQLEQQALTAMMNPHFIFNALNSIQHFLHTQSPEQANAYLVQFARLIRLTMEAVQAHRATLDQELERLALYLALEQLRFGADLTYHIDLDPAVDPEEVHLPAMLIQPFVENAIWHGILPTGRPGEVRISVQAQPSDHVHIQIRDNGQGIAHATPPASTERSPHVSRGIALSRDRLRHFHPQAQLQIREWQNASGQTGGTLVSILLPP